MSGCVCECMCACVCICGWVYAGGVFEGAGLATRAATSYWLSHSTASSIKALLDSHGRYMHRISYKVHVSYLM